MDLPQILLLTAIFVISIILTVIGVQIITLLRDAQGTLKRVDNLVSDLEYLANNVTRASSGFSHLATGLQSGMQVVGLITKLLSSSKKK